MKYVILEWDEVKLWWNVIHYTHDFDDFERMAEKYPMPKYTHMVNVGNIQSHEISLRVKAFKERMAKQ